MKYANAAWWIFLAWAAAKLRLPRRVAEDLYDEASMRRFECSLDFEPVKIVHPTGWRCEHVTITGSQLASAPTVYCGCKMQPVFPAETIA